MPTKAATTKKPQIRSARAVKNAALKLLVETPAPRLWMKCDDSLMIVLPAKKEASAKAPTKKPSVKKQAAKKPSAKKSAKPGKSASKAAGKSN